MKAPRKYLEDNYGTLSKGEQALVDVVFELQRRIETLESSVGRIHEQGLNQKRSPYDV